FSVSNSPYTITYNYSGDSTYVGSTDSSTTLTVTPAPLTITANNKSRTYGIANPTFDATYSAFVNGQGPSALTGTLGCITTAATNSPAGTYPINCSGQSSTNYAITYVAGTLTINSVPLTITASSGLMTYGGTVPTINPSYSGFINGDTATSLTIQPTCSTTATSKSPVGSYASTCSGAVDANYAISYVPGSVTVSAATATVTANDAGKTYGSADPALTASATGFTSADAASITLSATRASGESVGTYTITPSASGAALSNYTVTYVNGTFTISKAAATVTANNAGKTYGATDPTLTASATGFTSADAASITLSATRASGESVGTYTITPSASGTALGNYTVTYVNGTFNISQAPATVTANNAGKTYGATDPALTASATGFTTA